MVNNPPSLSSTDSPVPIAEHVMTFSEDSSYVNSTELFLIETGPPVSPGNVFGQKLSNPPGFDRIQDICRLFP